MTRRVIIVVVALSTVFFFTWVYAHHISNPLPTGTTIDRIVIEKSARKLSVLANGKTLKSYRVALGRSPVGAKQQEGDYKTPEGRLQNRWSQSTEQLSPRATRFISVR